MKKALAIDVGGTKIYSSIINQSGEILGEVERYSTPKTFEEIEQTFLNIIAKYEKDVDVVAFSTCGAVNNQNDGVIGSTANIASGYPQMKFAKLSTKPVYVENDANCAAWAEYEVGASKGSSTSIMITLGTGVGGGIIINGKLLKGQNGAAGEMHFKMYSDKRRKCTCGSWDCFEIYASGKGLKLTAEEILNDKSVTTYDVIEGVNNKNSKMMEVYNKWHEDITNGLIGLSNLFDPECIVLSGSLAEFVQTDLIEKVVNEEIVTTPVRVRKAMAGNYSGMIGAALLGLHSIENKVQERI